MVSAQRSRVLLVTTKTGTAGAERILVSLALGLADHQVEVVYLTGQASSFDLDLEAKGIQVQRFEGRRRRPFELLGRLRDLIRNRQPTLVHSHLFHANVLASKALRGARQIPLIHTTHIIERRFRPLRPWLERRAAARASRVVCVSHAVRTHLVESGWPADKLHTIHNGIDLTSFSEVPVIDLESEPVIVGVGRLESQKGFDLLLRAFARIAGGLPEARIEIAGTGPADQTLGVLASKLGIAERITWLGFRADVATVLSRARVVAFPSRYEGFGLVLAEAGAAARPVVAFDLPTTREILTDGSTGKIVAVRDLDAFAESLADLLRDPDRARQLGTAARVKIQQEFDEQRMVADYASLYAELS